MGFHPVSQAGLELLTSSDPPTSAFQKVGITGMSHHTWPRFCFNNTHSSETSFVEGMLTGMEEEIFKVMSATTGY